MQQIVVLGGLGFIGSHLCRALIASGYAVRVFDKLYASRHLVHDIADQLTIIEGDISRPHDVLAAIADCEIVINLVHTTVPGSSMEDPVYDVTTNVAAAAAWLSQLNKTNVQHLIYISSGGTVYGTPRYNPIDEEHPTNPISSYGITKLTIEKYAAMYAALYGIKLHIIRPSNVYGVGQQLNVGQGVIGVMLHRAFTGQPIEIWGSGSAVRDYLYISDLVQAVTRLITYQGSEQVFNVGSGIGISVLDIVDILKRHFADLAITYKPDRGFDVPVNVLNAARLQRETGWQPMTSLEDGIACTLDWLRDQN
jgi:UDP-glucose 4-epimerase